MKHQDSNIHKHFYFIYLFCLNKSEQCLKLFHLRGNVQSLPIKVVPLVSDCLEFSHSRLKSKHQLTIRRLRQQQLFCLLTNHTKCNNTLGSLATPKSMFSYDSALSLYRVIQNLDIILLPKLKNTICNNHNVSVCLLPFYDGNK